MIVHNMTHPFLAGERVYLRSLEMNDLPHFCQWFADRDVVQYSLSTWQFPTSQWETQAWLERTMLDKHTLTLGVVEHATQHLVGYAGITAISSINRSGEYYILIGDKASWGKGYGTEATKLIIAHGFHSLNLNRIALTVSDVNAGAVKAYTKAGFAIEGRLQQACYRNGAYHDKLVMAVLRETWAANTG